MKPDDTRITSYVLNELDAETRAAFEREMADSAELREAVKSTQQMRDLLETMPMPTTEFTKEQRQSLREQCIQNTRVARKRTVIRRVIVAGSLAAAACLVVWLSIPSITGSLSRSQKLALDGADKKLNVAEFETVRDEQKQHNAVIITQAPIGQPLFAVKDGKKEFEGFVQYGSPISAPVKADNVSALAPADNLKKEFAANKESGELVARAGGQLDHSSRTGGNRTGSIASETIFPFVSTGTITPTQPQVSAAPSTVDVDAARAQIASQPLIAANTWSAPVRQFNAGVSSKESADRSNRRVAQDHSQAAVSGNAGSLGTTNLRERSVESNIQNEARIQSGQHDTEAYDPIKENAFLTAVNDPLSTFSIDVDTASYSNVRRFIMEGQLPPVGAVRTEELLNYFPYSYPQPEKDAPFSVNVETARAPWDAKHLLVRIGLKGREISADKRPASNLVFLIDVSGSMQPENKLPLLKQSLQALVQKLDPKDRVAIVVYAGSSGLVLPSTSCRDKTKILDALDRLQSGGSTNGAQGIKLAYEVAMENFIKEGTNRVILCTDGDFNVGVTNQSELVKLIEDARASGVFLSVLGFGVGNLKDSTMVKLADKGNGNYAYIDSLSEGRKVLVEQMGGTLFTIAKDVKIQVEFNPAYVAGYRLIGYEKRLLAKEDFNDDKKDAGEIGAGHTVTALYEIVPAGEKLPDAVSVDPLKYQTPEAVQNGSHLSEPVGVKNNELMTVKLRYKAPDGDTSKLLVGVVSADAAKNFTEASSDFQFASAVAAFGMKLRNSPYHGDMSWEDIQRIVRGNLGEDPGSYRAEFLTLLEKIKNIEPRRRGGAEEDKE